MAKHPQLPNPNPNQNGSAPTACFVLSGCWQAASFIAEEILSEPVPFTMWGMEAIGSGIAELIKVGWGYVQQWSAWISGKICAWLTTSTVKVRGL